MYRYAVFAVVLGVIAFAASGFAANAPRQIQIETGGNACENTPVEVTLDPAGMPDAPAVKNTATGTLYPATLRDGKLVFIVDALAANAAVKAEVVPAERANGAAPRVNVVKKDGEDVIDVQIDGKPFTAYHHGVQWRKPFLWPVLSEGGVGVTRDFPMEVESTPKLARDHPHHKSLWSAYGEVNGHDLWAEGADAGNQRCKEVTFGSGDAYGWVRSVNKWETKDGTPLLDETREYRFYATPEKARFIDVFVTFKASQGDVLFSDTKEGGIVSVRMRPDICNAKAVITNALGDKGEDTAWGKPSPWCDFSGDVPGAGWRGITIFDNPANLRYPSSWHVRNYGLMGANAFGYSYFNEKEYNHGLIPENGDYTIPSGTELAFRYRVYVHSGNVEEAATAARFQDYITPPKVSVAE